MIFFWTVQAKNARKYYVHAICKNICKRVLAKMNGVSPWPSNWAKVYRSKTSGRSCCALCWHRWRPQKFQVQTSKYYIIKSRYVSIGPFCQQETTANTDFIWFHGPCGKFAWWIPGHNQPRSLSQRPISNCPSREVDPRKIQWPVPRCSACKAGKSPRGLGKSTQFQSSMTSEWASPITPCFLATGHLQDRGQERGLRKEKYHSSDIHT